MTCKKARERASDDMTYFTLHTYISCRHVFSFEVSEHTSLEPSQYLTKCLIHLGANTDVLT